MLAYSHPLVTKTAFLAELARHREQDMIVQGTYWQDGRGCAVGCSLNSVRQLTNCRLHRNDHAAYEEYLGVPTALAELEDEIFESLPVEQARLWPERFATAIPVGADLSGVVDAFLTRLLREIVLPTLRPEDDAVRAVVTRVVDGCATGWVADDRNAARDAASAAVRAAVRAAASAAASAAARAAARAAAWGAARDAATAAATAAARDAARGAASAAASAAMSAAARDAAWGAAWGAARDAAWAAASAAARDAMAGILCECLAAAALEGGAL